MEFSKNLEFIRQEKGFKSHKQFYSFLAERGVSINYQHFMKLVKGLNRATPEFVSQLTAILPGSGDDLVLSYCLDLFQNKKHLFTRQSKTKNIASQKNETISKHDGVPILNIHQVECLAKKKEIYFLFVIGTLSRRPLQIFELTNWFDQDILTECLKQLIKSKLFIKNESGYQTFSTEVRFPVEDKIIAGYYKKFDSWDLEFSSEMKFETILNKKFIRRISPRYIGLLLNHFSLVFDSVKASDEIDSRHNSDVIQLAVSLSKGQLPG